MFRVFVNPIVKVEHPLPVQMNNMHYNMPSNYTTKIRKGFLNEYPQSMNLTLCKAQGEADHKPKHM